MTQYAVPDDLKLYVKEEALAALTESVGTTPDADTINAALLAASSALDRACRRGSVVLPIVVDPYVVGLVCRLSLRALFGREVNAPAPEILKTTWEAAEAELRGIAEDGGGIESAAVGGLAGASIRSNQDRGWSNML